VILEVSEALVDVIEAATPDLNDWVELNSLAQGVGPGPTKQKAQLALIAVAPHPHMINRPLVEGIAGLVRAPLHLRLTYLVTYLDAHDEAQLRIDRIAQAFHTTPIIKRADLTPPLSDAVESITIRMLSPTADERNQIWGTLGRSGPLSLFYEVDVAPVPVIEREGAGRVKVHTINYVGAP
jgi:hypothetical protein